MNFQDAKDLASVAPIGTFIVAAGAFLLAWRSLQTQKRIARGRAAVDFFVKVEMEKALRDAYSDYLLGVEMMDDLNFDVFVETSSYKDVRTYLDIIELMAIGVNQDVFDQSVLWFLVPRSRKGMYTGKTCNRSRACPSRWRSNVLATAALTSAMGRATPAMAMVMAPRLSLTRLKQVWITSPRLP